MKEQAFYFLSVDKEEKTATLNFPEKNITVHGLEELEVLAGVTEQLSQSLKELLRCGFDYKDHDDEPPIAIDLEEMTSLGELYGDSQKL